MSLIEEQCDGFVMVPCYWLVGLPVGLEGATGYLPVHGLVFGCRKMGNSQLGNQSKFWSESRC